MRPDYTRELRISSPLHETAAAACIEHPGCRALITVDEHLVARVRTEFLARALRCDAPGATSDALADHTFVLAWDAIPIQAMSGAVKQVLDDGYAGCAFLPTQGSNRPALGFVRAGVADLHWLDFVSIVGPGLKRLHASNRRDRQTAAARPVCQGLGGLRIAVVGAELASRAALELVHSGATRLCLLDDGGRIDRRSLGLLADMQPQSIGQFRVDAVAARLRSSWLVDAEARAAECQDIGAALDGLNPDVVIGCETDPWRRAAVSAWCHDRLRLLVEVAPDDPWLRCGGRAVATLRTQVPGTRRSSGAKRAGACTLDLFDDLPPPDAGAALGGLNRHDLTLRLALYRRAARAAAAALADIVRGLMPPDLRIRVTQRGDGRIVGSVSEVVACDDAGAPAAAAALERPAVTH